MVARLRAGAICVTLLSCSLWAANGTVVVSSAPSTVIRLSVIKERLEGTGATLSQILQKLVAQPVRVPAPLAAERFDVFVTADRDRSLLDAFKAAAKDAGILLERTNELSPTIVLRPGTRLGVQLPTYASHVARSHFSCHRCGVAELRQALESSLKQKVVFEPDDLTFADVKVEWVDDASLTAGLRENLGLQLSREHRLYPIWTVSAQR